jgi:hypothetical protein
LVALALLSAGLARAKESARGFYYEGLLVVDVRDAETGRPLPGAPVSVTGVESTLVTDCLGRTEYSARAGRRRWLGYPMVRASKQGYLSASAGACYEGKDTVGVSLRLYVDLPRIAIGVVTDTFTGKPIFGATVVAAETVRTDSGGQFSVAAKPGRRRITVSAPGYFPRFESLQVRGGETAIVNPKLCDTTKAGEVTGTVTTIDEDAPLVGASVVINPVDRGDATNLDGHYRVRNIPAGEHVIEFSCVGCLTVLRRVVIRPGAHLRLDVRLEYEDYDPAMAAPVKGTH